MGANLPTPARSRNTRPKEIDSSSQRRGCCSGNHGRAVTQEILVKLLASPTISLFQIRFLDLFGIVDDREIMTIDQRCRPFAVLGAPAPGPSRTAGAFRPAGEAQWCLVVQWLSYCHLGWAVEVGTARFFSEPT